MIEKKYDPADYDHYVSEFMVKVYEDAERWQKSRKVSDKFELHNDMMALRTAIKVIASDGEISTDQRDEMLDYFLEFLA